MAEAVMRRGWALAPTHLLAVLTVGVGMVLMLLPPLGNEALFKATGLTVFSIGLWATGVMPPGVTAVAFFTLGVLLSSQSPAVIFSGFHTTALWLVFGGMVMSACVDHTGLGTRIAGSTVGRFRGSYLRILGGIALIAMLMSFLIPSTMGRVLLLIPVVNALADSVGFPRGSPGRTAMVMTAALVSFSAGGAVLPALMPGLVLAGAASSLYGIKITYGGFLWVHMPVMGVLKAAVIVVVLARLWPDVPRPTDVRLEAAPPMTGSGRLAVALMTISLALWITDAWHGISPAWVAMAAASVMLIPKLKLVPPKALGDKLDWGMFLYTGAVLGLGTVVTQSGLSKQLGQVMLAVLPFAQGADFTNFISLSLLAGMVGPVVTNPAVPAVLSPLAGEMAGATAMPLASVLMTQAIGFSTVLLPYYASPVFVSMQMGGVSAGAGARSCLATAVAIYVLLLPLDYLWWRAIGMF